MRFFAAEGTFSPAGLFGGAHLVYLLLSVCLIVWGARKKQTPTAVHRTLLWTVALFWFLEFCKVLFVLHTKTALDRNGYLPLYFCSLYLYAGVLATLCRGRLAQIGAVFLATGGLIGGACFLLFPFSSMTVYPALHAVTAHSFFLHATMVKTGICLLRSGYVQLHLQQLFGYVWLVVSLSAAAIFANTLWETNFMFLGKQIPGTPLVWLAEQTGGWFAPLLVLVQASVPFLLVYGVVSILQRKESR